MTDNGDTPKMEMQIALRQVRTTENPNDINQVIIGMARNGFEHYCTTLVPAKIARSSSMAGRFELMHFFRRMVTREVVPDALPGTADDQATGDALRELAGPQPALPAGIDEEHAAGDALAGLAKEAGE